MNSKDDPFPYEDYKSFMKKKFATVSLPQELTVKTIDGLFTEIYNKISTENAFYLFNHPEILQETIIIMLNFIQRHPNEITCNL